MASHKLARPRAGSAEAYAHLQPIVTQPIHGALIQQHYDDMIRYATALRLGPADSEAILRRFPRPEVQHPTSRALME